MRHLHEGLIGSTGKGSVIFGEAEFPEHYQRITTRVWEPNTGMRDFSVQRYIGIIDHIELEESFKNERSNQSVRARRDYMSTRY